MAGAHLHLYNVQVKDGGTYQCEAANSKGKDYHSARVSVEGMQHAVSLQQHVIQHYVHFVEVLSRAYQRVHT